MDIKDAWKSVCKILLHEEIGELCEYGPYLKKFVGPVRGIRKSCLSGKPVTTADDDIMENARYISNSERAGYVKRFSAPFNINEIKDIDSLIASIGERFIYSGDILLGNSEYAESVQRCSNVSHAYNSQDVSDSKFIAHCAMLRHSQYVFGSDCTGEIEFVIKNFQGWRSRRMFETANTQYVSDAYFCANIRNCNECLFSFNQRSKNCMIGNLELERTKYLQLKGKLLAEIAGELRKNKDILSLNEIFCAPARGNKAEERPCSWDVDSKKAYFGRPSDYPAELDLAFASTVKVLLGAPLPGNMTDYENWLMRYVRAPAKSHSAVSKKPILILPILFNEPIRPTHVTEKEADLLGKKAISIEEIESLSIKSAKQTLKPIAFFTCDVSLGKNCQLSEVVSHSDSYSVFASSTMYNAKNCAYCCWVSHGAENMFGCDHTFYSQFCINCYRSLNLVRCFEVSDSRSCSDCMFCHNCENVKDSMFCFNAKNLRHAIGNVEFERGEYLRLKKEFQNLFSFELAKTKALRFGIYSLNIGR